ncbi:hypothetical protein NDI45_20525 [Leptolyngbya sp. GB1-A1]|uniref:hypothetical protein n=1 Tax=Leptolyngbya sp. GB1-A1 TaxID=2933908 RepID=UPI00329A561F
MRQFLGAIARLLTQNQCDALTLDWADLRSLHTVAVRSVLAEIYAPATASRMLCALRRILKEAQRLGLMSAEDYARTTNIKLISGNWLLRDGL